jgi:hypothetical protein
MASRSRSDLAALFDGTWRPDYGPPGPDADPDVVSLVGGIYECQTCRPPYGVLADGEDHRVDGHPRFDTLAIAVVDDRTVRQVGRRDGMVTFEATTSISADGDTRTETWTAANLVDGVIVPVTAPMAGPPDVPKRPVQFVSSATRIGPRRADAHLVSGAWRVVALDLLNHDEDTVYRIEGDALRMTDKLGRSFDAKLDGTEAPYHGDPRFTGVSLEVIDERTIEERDLRDGVVVQATRWRVEPDGRTMHVRFDDLHGHVMEQTGHKLP